MQQIVHVDSRTMAIKETSDDQRGELEAIVKEMEGGDLPLERALAIFERGMKLSESCRKQLAEAETRVEILTKRAGSVQPEPFPKA